MRIVWLAVLAVMSVAGCALKHPPLARSSIPQPVYEMLHPYAIELCALSRINPRDAKKGNRFGHAVMYLKGACRQPGAPYPRLQVCDEAQVDLASAEAGVGVSVNRAFKNVNWVAVPGKQLFIHGYLREGEILTEEARRRAIGEAVRLAVFRGVKFHERDLTSKPPTMDEEEFMATQSVGTDYAVTFARTALCASLPVTRGMLERSVAFLNALNEDYSDEDTDYNWHAYHDNCTHMVRNAIAAAGVWEPKAVWETKVKQFFHLAIPANELASLALLANREPLENVAAICRDSMKRTSLMEEGWLPTRHGVLLETLPAHQANVLYDTQFRLFVLENPLLRRKSRAVHRMLRDARFTDLRANLVYFQERYRAMLKRHAAEAPTGAHGRRCRAVQEAHARYLQTQLEAVTEKLAVVSGFSHNGVRE
jgi:hypothetical protein